MKPRTLADVATIPCTYCGLPADTRDHVIPQAARGSVPPEWLLACPDTVPACRECNSLANDRIVVRSVDEKRDEIHELLRRRYRKLLAKPDWDSTALRTMGPAMRRQIRATLHRRDVLLQRLAWPYFLADEYLGRNDDAKVVGR